MNVNNLTEENSSFRLLLHNEFAKRRSNNRNYSLRAFARSLGIHHGTLSQIINGKRTISETAFNFLTKALTLSPADVDRYRQSLGFERTDKAVNLTIDSFVVISEWYHDAILELVQLSNFKPDPKWIAKKLGIKVRQVEDAILRLQRLELIDITPTGEWVNYAKKTAIAVEDEFTNTALKKYQKQVLQMAIDSIDEIPRPDRVNISSTLAIDIKDLPNVKKLVNGFRKKLATYVQRERVKSNEVYQLGICFYPLTNKNQE